MKSFAVVEGTNVTNCIMCENLEIANSVISEGQVCVEFSVPSVGDTYSNGAFIKQHTPETEKSWAMQ